MMKITKKKNKTAHWYSFTSTVIMQSDKNSRKVSSVHVFKIPKAEDKQITGSMYS